MRAEVFHGILAGLLLLTAYVGLLYGLNGSAHVLEQFRDFGILIAVIVVGFGFQVGLFSYARSELKAKQARAQLAATGSVSGGTMIACCLHHVTEILPLVGATAFGLALAEYTFQFLFVGALSAIVGALAMLAVLQQHNVFPFPSVQRVPWKEARNFGVSFALIAAVAVFLFSSFPLNTIAASPNSLSLSSQSDSQNSVQVDVTPRISSAQAAFEISFTTHSGSMDFRVEDISRLEDDLGNSYRVLSWNGSPPGGHHRSGTLSFEPLSPQAKTITLKLSNVGGVDRVFQWSLK
ncbi:MAG: hypothetical protein V1847_03825 [Candidatus Diapherotrites archaeon]